MAVVVVTFFLVNCVAAKDSICIFYHTMVLVFHDLPQFRSDVCWLVDNTQLLVTFLPLNKCH